jgi:MtrB/PioB family decaheme-associated outer membrane protein
MRGLKKAALPALVALLASAMPAAANAQSDDDELDSETTTLPAATGEIALGVMLFDESGDAAKFNQFRDARSGLLVDRLLFDYDAPDSRRYFDFRGYNLGRDDADVLLGFGSFRAGADARGWMVDIGYKRTPNLLSNRAMTPYDYLGNGRYRVDRSIIDAIQISNIDDARSWTAPNAGPGGVGEDLRIAAVVAGAVKPIALGTQRDTGTLGYTALFSERTKATFDFKHDDRNGSVVAGVSVGDRPPRSGVVQLPEPIDQTTYDFKVGLEHIGRNFHVDGSYLYSRFSNAIDTLSWNSLFYAPGYFSGPDAEDYDAVRRGTSTLFATNLAMALAPDNTAQQFVVNGGLSGLPLNGSLSATVSQGVMKQDEELLPFASSDFGGRQDPSNLPRATAEARIETSMFNLVYTANPLQRMRTRLHYRYYDLDNQTPQDAWFGNTADTSSRNYRSQRYNIGYDLTQENFGADVSWYFGKAGTLGLMLERESKERPQRAVAETDEDSYRLSYRVRTGNRSTLSAKIGRRNREGSPYNSEITDQTYAYDPFTYRNAEDNPLASFGDHPALRRFDVVDRKRDEFDLSLAYMASETVQTRMSYGYRRNDYQQAAISPEITIWDATQQRMVDTFFDPTQLGLLADRSRRIGFDLTFTPNEEVVISLFAAHEAIDLDQRGRYMNENIRTIGNANSSIAAGTMDYQDGTGKYLWDASIADRTDSLGADFNWAPIDAAWQFSAGYQYSRGTVGIDYSPGYYTAEDDTTSYANWSEWSSPPDARFRTGTLTLHWRRALSENWALGLRYLYETYRISDWQQEATSSYQDPMNPWFVREYDREVLGTSQDRAGNRLVRLGDLLAPAYDVHVALVTFEYRW